MRYEQGENKTEFGVIPTYKGRVSSTGLSKDGWISGLRHVQSLPKGKLELVIGELDHVDDPDALQNVHNIDYLELEFSSHISKNYSYEIGLERMVEANFIRGEVRYELPDNQSVAVELVNRLDTHSSKVILSMEGTLNWIGKTEYFAYYSYVDPDFGQRAELTEDFIEFGHSTSIEIEGQLKEQWQLKWFSKIEVNEGQSRFQLGIKYKL